MYYHICRIDKELYSCVTRNITTDEVVITDTQIQHINERHQGAYEAFFEYLSDVITDPDYIIEANKPNTAVLLKEISCDDKIIKLVLRLCTFEDPTDYRNSIITFLRIDEKDWQRLIRNKKVLYKRE